MPSVAVCISGHIRQPVNGHNNLCEKLICANPDLDFDVFIHTWDQSDWNGEYVTPEVLAPFEARLTEVEPVKTWDTSELLKAPQSFITPGTDGSHVLSMFYKVKRCHEMMASFGKHYDLVIRARTDLEWDEPLPLDVYLDAGNKVFVPNGGTILPTTPTHLVKDIEVIHSDFKVIPNFFCCANDQFAVSSYDNMAIYANTYNNISLLVAKHGIFCPEALLYQQLSDNGLQVVPIKRGSYLHRRTGERQYFGP